MQTMGALASRTPPPPAAAAGAEPMDDLQPTSNAKEAKTRQDTRGARVAEKIGKQNDGRRASGQYDGGGDSLRADKCNEVAVSP